MMLDLLHYCSALACLLAEITASDSDPSKEGLYFTFRDSIVPVDKKDLVLSFPPASIKFSYLKVGKSEGSGHCQRHRLVTLLLSDNVQLQG